MPETEKYNINHSWQRRNCPICGSSDFRPKPESSAQKPAERMSWAEAKSYFIGLRNDQVFFSYYRCDNCELLYCPWYFTKISLEFYMKSYKVNIYNNSYSEELRKQNFICWYIES